MTAFNVWDMSDGELRVFAVLRDADELWLELWQVAVASSWAGREAPVLWWLVAGGGFARQERDMTGDRRPTIEVVIKVVDGLGHELPASGRRLTEQMLAWLDLEAACGDLSPGLAELRDRLREDVDRAPESGVSSDGD